MSAEEGRLGGERCRSGDLHALEATVTDVGVDIVLVPGLVCEARLLNDDVTRKMVLA